MPATLTQQIKRTITKTKAPRKPLRAFVFIDDLISSLIVNPY
jgi:hypothetical protein